MTTKNKNHDSSHFLSSIASERIHLEQDFAEHPESTVKMMPDRYSQDKKSFRSSFPEPSETFIHQQQQANYPLKHVGLHLNFNNQMSECRAESVRFNKGKIMTYEMIKNFESNQNQAMIQRKQRKKLQRQSKNKSTDLINAVWRSQNKEPNSKEKKNIQLEIIKPKNMVDTIILNHSFSNTEVTNQIKLKFSMKKNQSLEIFKLKYNQNLQIKLEQDTIKYKIERYITRLKFILLVICKGEEKFWKDIQIPILSHDINNQNILSISEKPSGKIDVIFDDFNFSFSLKTPTQNKLFYGIKSTVDLSQIRLQQKLPQEEKEDKFCESKCQIF